MEWEESYTDNVPTVIFIPQLSQLKNDEIKAFSIEKIADSEAGYLIIPATNKGELRTLNLTFE